MQMHICVSPNNSMQICLCQRASEAHSFRKKLDCSRNAGQHNNVTSVMDLHSSSFRKKTVSVRRHYTLSIFLCCSAWRSVDSYWYTFRVLKMSAILYFCPIAEGYKQFKENNRVEHDFRSYKIRARNQNQRKIISHNFNLNNKRMHCKRHILRAFEA